MDGLGIGLIIGIFIVIVGVTIFGLRRVRSKRPEPSFARPMPANETGYGAQVAVRDDSQAPEPLFGDQNSTLPDIFQFETGAYIQYGVVRNHIHGRVKYREGKYTWVEYYLTDTSWLGADKDEGVPQLINWERVIPGDLVPNGQKSIVFKGVTYEFVERGEATYQASGETGDLSGTGTVEYFDYATSDGENHLSLERYDGDGDWEAAIGETVVIGLVDYYPPGQYVPDAEQR